MALITADEMSLLKKYLFTSDETADYIRENHPDAGAVPLILHHARLIFSFTNAIQLHIAMREYNWDDGLFVPKMIISHPHCDLATVIMAYWLSGAPDVYDNDPEKYEYMEFRSFIEIAAENGLFPTGAISFDPKNEHDLGMDIGDPAPFENGLKTIFLAPIRGNDISTIINGVYAD